MDREMIHLLADSIHGIDARVQDLHSDVMMNCPFAPFSPAHKHDFDKRPSFSVKVEDHKPSVARCFTCENRGGLRYLIERLNKLSNGAYKEALELVRAYDAPSLVERFKYLNEPPVRSKPEAKRNHPHLSAANGEAFSRVCARKIPRYAEDRGITYQTSRKWLLGYDENLERMTMPTFSSSGDFVGVIGRAIGDHPKRYHVYKDFSPNLGSYLFGEHLLDPTDSTIYLVEGPIDAIYASQVLGNVVALMGSSLSSGQRQRVKALAKKAVIMSDGDEAGRKLASQIVSSLKSIMPVKYCPIPDGADPGSMPFDQLRGIAKDSVLLL